MSEVDSEIKSRQEKDEKQKKEIKEAAMKEVKVRLANKIKKIFTQEQKLVKIIEFPEKHAGRLSEKERRAKEEAERAAQDNFDLP